MGVLDVMMFTGKEGLLEALMEAFLMEKGTMEFYCYASGRANHPEAKRTYMRLTGWEVKHMDYIQFLYQAFQYDRDLQGFSDFRKNAEAPFTEGGMPLEDLKAGPTAFRFVDDAWAVHIALGMETKAYRLYRKLSEVHDDLNAKTVFEDLMWQEAKHIRYLNALLPKLKGGGEG